MTLEVHVDEFGDHVCQHGVAMDVHCCNCHSGFLFDPDHVCSDDDDDDGDEHDDDVDWDLVDMDDDEDDDEEDEDEDDFL